VTYPYSAYGLALQSQTAIAGLSAVLPPNLEPSRVEANQIEVSTGTCPAWADAALRQRAEPIYGSAAGSEDAGATFRLSQLGGDGAFQFSYGDGTRFVVDAKTQRIWGDCPPPLTQEDLITYLVGPVLGFVLRRRGVLALHASSFSKGGFAFALCGGPGMGKSTTAAALAIRGIPIQCEDITALRDRADGFWAAPGYPRVNLWPESVANLFGTATAAALPRITPNWEKRFLSLDGLTTKFENRERQLGAVYVFAARSDDKDAPRIEALSTREAALLLVQNTYMNYLLGKEQRAAEFDAISRLVSRVPVRRLIPNGDPEKIASMCELLQIDAAEIAATLGSTAVSQRS
jgi:hypothetical protein